MHCSIHGDCKDRTPPALPPPRQCHDTGPGEELTWNPRFSPADPELRGHASACTVASTVTARIARLRRYLRHARVTHGARRGACKDISARCSRAPCPCQCSHCDIHGDNKDRAPPALQPSRQCRYTVHDTELARILSLWRHTPAHWPSDRARTECSHSLSRKALRRSASYRARKEGHRSVVWIPRSRTTPVLAL